MWFKRMMIAYVHGVRDCPGYPGQSAQSDRHVGGKHDVSENTLFYICLFHVVSKYKATHVKMD